MDMIEKVIGASRRIHVAQEGIRALGDCFDNLTERAIRDNSVAEALSWKTYELVLSRAIMPMMEEGLRGSASLGPTEFHRRMLRGVIKALEKLVDEADQLLGPEVEKAAMVKRRRAAEYVAMKRNALEMTFPKHEYDGLMSRLRLSRPIYTTRTLNEQGKYTEGTLVKTPFGYLEVVEVKTYDKLEDHPFLNELTDKEKSYMEVPPFDVVKLEQPGNTGSTT